MSFFQPLRHHSRRLVLGLLDAERPVPSRTEAETAAEVEANYHWNLTVNLLDGTFFWFALSFISAGTIVPLFVSKLSSSPLAIGLVAVIASGGWFLPQLFAANWIERLPRMKPVVIKAGFFLERLPVWAMAGTALLAGPAPALALGLFFGVYAWRGFGGGLVGPAWQDLIARCFPVDRRGRFMGMANFMGSGAGAAGAALSTWLLAALAFPHNFVAIFAIAAMAISLSWFCLSLTREPAQPASQRPLRQGRFLDKLPAILRSDANFRRFLWARSLIALGGMGSGFVTVAAVQRWAVPDSTVGLYTAAYWLGQTVGNLAFGFLADRFGHKLSLELGTLAAGLSMALAWLAPSPGWIFAVFVLVGINFSAIIGSGVLVALEFSGPQRRPTYVGITNTTVGLVNVSAPLLGAWLAGISYPYLFAAAAAVNLVALAAMRLWVREPRWAAGPAAQPAPVIASERSEQSAHSPVIASERSERGNPQ